MQFKLIVVMSVLLGLAAVVFCLAWISLRQKKSPIASSGILLLVAAFCGYGFLASGEYDGVKELTWKIGYATVGAVSLAAVILLAVKSRATGGERGATGGRLADRPVDDSAGAEHPE